MDYLNLYKKLNKYEEFREDFCLWAADDVVSLLECVVPDALNEKMYSVVERKAAGETYEMMSAEFGFSIAHARTTFRAAVDRIFRVTHTLADCGSFVSAKERISSFMCPLFLLKLSTRAENCCALYNVENVNDLVQFVKSGLYLKARGAGPGVRAELCGVVNNICSDM